MCKNTNAILNNVVNPSFRNRSVASLLIYCIISFGDVITVDIWQKFKSSSKRQSYLHRRVGQDCLESVSSGWRWLVAPSGSNHYSDQKQTNPVQVLQCNPLSFRWCIWQRFHVSTAELRNPYNARTAICAPMYWVINHIAVQLFCGGRLFHIDDALAMKTSTKFTRHHRAGKLHTC